jgi:hypothetical protein
MENLKIPYRFFSKLNSGAQESNLVSLGYGPRMVFRSTRPRQILFYRLLSDHYSTLR